MDVRCSGHLAGCPPRRGAVARATLVAFLVLHAPVTGAQPIAPPAGDAGARPVLWVAPTDIQTRDLFYGPGGRAAVPQGPMRFVAEGGGGTSRKLELRDAKGDVWIAKLGREARPETAAARLLWAVGFAADQGYVVPELVVENVPDGLLAEPGVLRDARFERRRDGTQRAHAWAWRRNPFLGTPAFDGLRVMMALMNNWDLKDENNVVYLDADAGGAPGAVAVYEVADLGATFGTTGYVWRERHAKGNADSYRRSRFIGAVTDTTVDFAAPGRPPILQVIALPDFMRRMHMLGICHGIPRAHARWMGDLLAQLSVEQLRDAFRAARFAPGEIEVFVTVLRDRIARLTSL